MIGILSVGVAGGAAFLVQEYVYRRYDAQCEYPSAGLKWPALSFALAGVLNSSGIGAVPSASLSGFLTFAAFTDYHTGYLYSMSSLVAGAGGLGFLLMAFGVSGALNTLAGLLPFAALLLIYRLTGAVNTGDVEVMAALSVWMAYVAGKPDMGCMGISAPAICVLILAAILCACRTLGGRRAKKVAFAPYILPAAITVLYCHS